MFASANRRIVRLLGYHSFADLEAVPFLDLVPSAHRSDVKQHLLGTETDSLPDHTAEIPLRTADGDVISVQVRYEKLQFNNEDCIGITLSPLTAAAKSDYALLPASDSSRSIPAGETDTPNAATTPGTVEPDFPVLALGTPTASPSNPTAFVLGKRTEHVVPVPRPDHIQSICNFIVDHNRALLITSTVFAAFFLLFLPRVKFIDNIDSFTLTDSPAIAFYHNFKRTFGNDEFFVVAFQKHNIFTPANLSLLQEITHRLETIPEARRVRSLANVDEVRGGSGTFDVLPLMSQVPKTAAGIARLRYKATHDPLYVKSLISADGRVASIVIFARYAPNDESYRKRLLDKTITILKPYQDAGTEFHLAGWTVTNFSVSDYMRSDVAIFMPVTFGLIVLTVWLVFRNKWILLLGTLNITVCLGATMGVLGLTGITINPVTAIAIPLTLALSLFDTIHIFSNMDVSILRSSQDRYQALKRVLRLVFWPCLFTTITTAVGFLSLGLDKVPVIREFAWAATSGMAFEWIYAFGLLPGLILLFRGETLYQNYYNQSFGARTALMDQMLEAVHNFLLRHHRSVLVVTILLVSLAIPNIPKIPVQTNFVEYFKSSSHVREDVEWIENHLAGSSSFDIAFRAKQTDDIKVPAVLAVIEKIEQHARSLAGVDVALSIVDFLKEVNQAFHDGDPAYYRLPESRNLVAQYLLLYGGSDINDFVNPDYDQARIAVRSSIHSSDRQKQLLDNLQDYIAKTPHPGLDIRVTGLAQQEVDTVDALVNGQVLSIGAAFFIISILMGVALKSVKLGMLSLVPNSIPIVLNFGLMGAAGIELNTGTALISSVAIGIAVDNTVHFLTQYQMKREEGLSTVEAVRSGIKVKGRAMISSTIIVCIGFGVLVLASFVPTVYFGLLNTFIMIVALLADAVVLPSLILLRAK